MDKVSVVVPCYNQAHYLEECLNSILNQHYQNWECVIVNDGSIDGTEKVALTFCSLDRRFIYIKKENGGLSSARNAALKIIKGEFVQFLDSDDIILPNKFSSQIHQMYEARAEVSICKYKLVNYLDKKNYDGEYLRVEFVKQKRVLIELIEDWEETLSIPCHCFLFRRSLLQNNDLRFNQELPNHEDWAFWCQVFASNPHIAYVNEILCIYYLHQNSMSVNRQKMEVGFNMAINYLKSQFNDTEVIQSLNRKSKQIKYYYPTVLTKKIVFIKTSIKHILSTIGLIKFEKC